MAGIAGVGRMAPPSSTRISARMDSQAACMWLGARQAMKAIGQERDEADVKKVLASGAAGTCISSTT